MSDLTQLCEKRMAVLLFDYKYYRVLIFSLKVLIRKQISSFVCIRSVTIVIITSVMNGKRKIFKKSDRSVRKSVRTIWIPYLKYKREITNQIIKISPCRKAHTSHSVDFFLYSIQKSKYNRCYHLWSLRYGFIHVQCLSLTILDDHNDNCINSTGAAKTIHTIKHRSDNNVSD